MDNLEDLMLQAIEKSESLETGTVFVLKDLFEGTFWNQLKKGLRLSLGKLFKNKVENGTINNVIFLGKRENNSSEYQKI